MATKTIRKIVKIDEDKCNGCGACAITCAEGALKIIDGKARLISDKYCDGLGACLGECPQDAITIEERESEAFDEQAVHQHLHQEPALACGCPGSTVREFEPAAEPGMGDTLPCGCPATTVQEFESVAESECHTRHHDRTPSMLRHWPVQLTLVPPGAPFLRNADVLLTAHCVPFAYAGFHQELLADHSLLIACPKLDDFTAHTRQLTEILRHSDIKSLTVVHMEVPCCAGLTHMARQAIQQSGKNIPLSEIVISVTGEVHPGG